jgi:O-antigen ligase
MGTIFGDDSAKPNDYDSGGLTEARWNVWMTGLRIMLENPLFGVGAANFEIAEGMTHGGTGKWDAAHNSFIQVGAELGVGGLALFLFLLYRGVKNSRIIASLSRRDARLRSCLGLAPGIEVSLYGYIVMGTTLSHGYSYIAYVFLGLSVAMLRLARTLPTPSQAEPGVISKPSRASLSGTTRLSADRHAGAAARSALSESGRPPIEGGSPYGRSMGP